VGLHASRLVAWMHGNGTSWGAVSYSPAESGVALLMLRDLSNPSSTREPAAQRDQGSERWALPARIHASPLSLLQVVATPASPSAAAHLRPSAIPGRSSSDGEQDAEEEADEEEAARCRAATRPIWHERASSEGDDIRAQELFFFAAWRPGLSPCRSPQLGPLPLCLPHVGLSPAQCFAGACLYKPRCLCHCCLRCIVGRL
jgi:hypothetical protein